MQFIALACAQFIFQKLMQSIFAFFEHSLHVWTIFPIIYNIYSVDGHLDINNYCCYALFIAAGTFLQIIGICITSLICLLTSQLFRIRHDLQIFHCCRLLHCHLWEYCRGCEQLDLESNQFAPNLSRSRTSHLFSPSLYQVLIVASGMLRYVFADSLDIL